MVLLSNTENTAPYSPLSERQGVHCLLKTMSVETVLSREIFELSAPQLSEASILCFLRAHHREWLQCDGY